MTFSTWPVTARDRSKEEQGRVRDLARVEHLARERLLASGERQDPLVARGPGRHRRPRDRRRDRVHPDPVADVRRGHRGRQRVDRALRGGIGVRPEQLRNGVGRGHAAHQQDRAARARVVGLLAPHLAHDGAADERLRPEVERERRVPRVGVELVDRAVAEPAAAAARDGEEAVDPSERRRRAPTAASTWAPGREVRGVTSGAAAVPVIPSTSARTWSPFRDVTKTAAPSSANSSAETAAIPVDPVTRQTRPAGGSTRPAPALPRTAATIAPGPPAGIDDRATDSPATGGGRTPDPLVPSTPPVGISSTPASGRGARGRGPGRSTTPETISRTWRRLATRRRSRSG